jgi:hypothetical protein
MLQCSGLHNDCIARSDLVQLAHARLLRICSVSSVCMLCTLSVYIKTMVNLCDCLLLQLHLLHYAYKCVLRLVIYLTDIVTTVFFKYMNITTTATATYQSAQSSCY